MGFLDSLTGGSGPVENPELDKTKKALEGLKPQVEGKQIDQVFLPLDEGLKKDLAELGITDPKEQEGYINQVHEKVKAEMDKATPDYQALVSFVDNPQSLTGLNEIIQGKKPTYELTKQLETVTKAYPKLSWLTGLAPILIMLKKVDTMEKNAKRLGKDASLFDKAMAMLGLSDDDDKKGEKKESAELTEPLLAAVKKAFKDKNINLFEEADDKTLKGDFKWLVGTVKMPINETNIQELVDKAFIQNEKVKKLIGLADTKMDIGVSFRVRLMYLRLKDVPGPDMDTLCNMLESKDGTYELPAPITNDNIKTLLYEVVLAKDAKTALEKYKKKAPAVAQTATPQNPPPTQTTTG
jgi:hypothetical protein